MTYNNELYHHGIKGQKWGVRRFQNPDGTRTAAGKKRFSQKQLRMIDREIDSKRKEYIKEHYSGSSVIDYVKVSRAGRRYGEKILSEKYGNEPIERINKGSKRQLAIGVTLVSASNAYLISDLMRNR